MATAISGETPSVTEDALPPARLPRAPATAPPVTRRAHPKRRGTLALANSTVNALVQQVREGDDRARHEAYGSLWRLVRSSKKLQLSVFDTLQRLSMLKAVFDDISNAFRGLRQSAAKLLMSLVHRSSYIQAALKQSTGLVRFTIPTDAQCAMGGRTEQNNMGRIKDDEHSVAQRSSRCCICLLACGREFTRQESRLKALRSQAVLGVIDNDDSALGTAIITATLADARFMPGERRDYDQEAVNKGLLLPIATASTAVTVPSLDWQNGPIDPDRFLLGFADNISQSNHGGDRGRDPIGAQSVTPETVAQPMVVRRHMHRWKEHVSSSLLTQLSVLHDIYRTSIIVERRQRSKDDDFESTVVSGSVSKTLFSLVLRYSCTESARVSGQEQLVNDNQRWNHGGPVLEFLESEDAAVRKTGDAPPHVNGSSATATVTTARYNSSLAHIHRIISSEVNVRKLPHGLRGVMLFEDFLVSRHDNIFTEYPGRIRSWKVFRRYWVHRWAADRLRSQVGQQTCKLLLDCFDDTVEQSTYLHKPTHARQKRDDEWKGEGEVRVKCSEFYRHLEADSFLSNHKQRDLILSAVSLGTEKISPEKDEGAAEGAISWGMYMHALVFHIHKRHTKENKSRARKARDASMNSPKPFKYSDPRATLTTIQSRESVDQNNSATALAGAEGVMSSANSEDFFSSSSSNAYESSSDDNDGEDVEMVRSTTKSQYSDLHRHRQLDNAGEDHVRGKRQDSRQPLQPSHRPPGRATAKMTPPFDVSRTFRGERLQSRRHELIHRLAHKQRRLRNMELELQRADDIATEKINQQRLMSPSRKRRLEERDAHENAKRGRLRARVHNLRHNISRLNEKVGMITGGEHKLVTAATGISLVQEASRISRLDDAKSKHKREVHARVRRNKRALEEQIERKRKVVEAKAARKMNRPVSGMRSRQRFGALGPTHAAPRRPASAGARTRRSRGGVNHRSAGVTRGRSVTRMQHRSRSKRAGKSSPSTKLRTKRVDRMDADDNDSGVSIEIMSDANAGATSNHAGAADDMGDVDTRMHEFGMPGYGTSRAWQELKLFFAERVRINKAKAAKAQRRRASIIQRRESDHIKRVQRRKNARSRSAHTRLVVRHRATEKVLAERARRKETEASRVSDAHERQHAEDVTWIKSSQFSPRARGSAYDSMRRLAYSKIPASKHKEHREFGGRYSRVEDTYSSVRTVGVKSARPQSASPRLRNKQNATSLILSNRTKLDYSTALASHVNTAEVVSIPLDLSLVPSQKNMDRQRPYTAEGMHSQMVGSGFRPEAEASRRTQRHYDASSASLSARVGSQRIELPTRPSTARPIGATATRPNTNDTRGTTKHSQLVAELADAKKLLEDIKSEQEALQGRVSRTLSESDRHGRRESNNSSNTAGNPQSSDTNGGLPGFSSSPSSIGKAITSKAGGHEQSLVKAAIVEAVQMQMLRQWPSKHMSLRVRRLVHAQLRSHAETRADNVELDHATQRLTGKKTNIASVKTSLHLQGSEDAGNRARSGSGSGDDKSITAGSGNPGSEPGKPPAPRVRPKEAPSAFERMRSVSGASPLIKFRRIRSENL